MEPAPAAIHVDVKHFSGVVDDLHVDLKEMLQAADSVGALLNKDAPTVSEQAHNFGSPSKVSEQPHNFGSPFSKVDTDTAISDRLSWVETCQNFPSPDGLDSIDYEMGNIPMIWPWPSRVWRGRATQAAKLAANVQYRVSLVKVVPEFCALFIYLEIFQRTDGAKKMFQNYLEKQHIPLMTKGNSILWRCS